MKILIYILFIILMYSCHIKKDLINNKQIEKTNEQQIGIDSNCIQNFNFTELEYFQCYKSVLLKFSYDLYNRKFYKDFGLIYLLNITIKFTQSHCPQTIEADDLLYEFLKSRFVIFDTKYSYSSPMQFGNNDVNLILIKWNTKKSFDICIQYMSKNRHDSMGHGDCINLGVRFFEEIVLPKIKSIDGVDFWAYFDKNTKGVNYGPGDCFDSFYEAMYPLLKKAWEEGKIELKETTLDK